MSASGPAAAETILARMRVPKTGYERVLVLGCYERPATLYMQQVRALNLIHALLAAAPPADAPPDGSALAVIGAGAGGVTAAAAAAICGWRVSIFDRIGGDVLSFAGADTAKRWLHPHIYEWPAPGKERNDAGLPILDWNGGPASQVISRLRRQWHAIAAQNAIDQHLGAANVSLTPHGQKYLVSWNGARATSGHQSGAWGARPGKRMHLQSFDVVILAVGFGEERPTDKFPVVTSYWKADNVDAYKIQESATPTVLVSGTGDGGLIDVLRYGFPEFRHDEVLRQLRESWLGDASFDAVRRSLRDIEATAVAARARGEPYEAELNHRYRQLGDSLMPLRPIQLRSDVIPFLTGTSPLPLTLEAAPLNRFLFSLTNAQYIPGPIESAVRTPDGRFAVRFPDRPDPRMFDDVVIRHGPASALKDTFREIHDWCEPLRKLAKHAPDPTREPHFAGDARYVETLARAGRAAMPAVVNLRTDELLRTATAAAASGDPRTTAFAAYQKVLAARWRLPDDDAPIGTAPAGDGRPAEWFRRRWARLVVPGTRRFASANPDAAQLGATERVDAAWLARGPSARVIIGDAGAGKTVLLTQVARELVQGERVFVVLTSLDKAPVASWHGIAQDAFDWMLLQTPVGATGHERDEHADALRRLYDARLLQGHVVFLFDDFDALKPAERDHLLGLVEKEAASWGRAKLMLAARAATAATVRTTAVPVYQLVPPSRREVEEVVRRALANRTWLKSARSLVGSAAGGLAQAGDVVDASTLAALYTSVDAALDAARAPNGLRRALEQIALRTFPADAEFDRAELTAAAVEVAERGSGTAPARADHDSNAGAHEHAGVNVDTNAEGDIDERVIEALLGDLLVRRKRDEVDVYAFSDRLVQLHLAAVCLAGQRDSLAHIARLALDPERAETDLGALAAARMAVEMQAQLCERLAALPESLDYAVLRFRARALLYVAAAPSVKEHAERLAEELAAWVAGPERGSEDPFLLAAAGAIGRDTLLAEALGPRIASLVDSPDLAVRKSAIGFLGAARMSGSAVDVLTPLLFARDKALRDGAARALGRLGDHAALAPLVTAYKNGPGDFVFEEAVQAIAKIGGPAACAALAAMLADVALFRNLRWPAARALAELDDPAAVPALLAVVGDGEDIVRESAAEALARIPGAAGVPAVAEALAGALGDVAVGVRLAAARTLRRLAPAGAHVAEALASAMNDGHLLVRKEAARALLSIDRDRGLRTLRDALASPSSEWRGDIVELMAEELDVGALESALLVSTDADANVRDGAARALGLIKAERASARLRDLVHDSDESVRAAAIQALEQHLYSAALPELRWCAEHDGSSYVRDQARRALATLRDEAVVPILERAVAAGDVTAAPPLGRIGKAQSIAPLAAQWQRVKVTSSQQFFVGDLLTWAIGRIDGEAAGAVLRELLVEAKAGTRREAGTAVPPDVAAEGSEEGGDTGRAAQLALVAGLIEMRHVAAVPGLLVALGSADPAVSSYARWALTSRKRTQLLDGLKRALADGDPVVRRQAAQVTPFYADTAAAAALEQLAARDQDRTVSQAAGTAIQAYGRMAAMLAPAGTR